MIKTKIAWADHTASPWYGCTEVSPGCANCYARELTMRFKLAQWGNDAHRVRSKTFSTTVRKWAAAAAMSATRPRVFTSLMDWLDPQVPAEVLAGFLKVVRETPHLTWLLLTKRPEAMSVRLEAAQDWCFDQGDRNLCGWLQDWRKHRIAPHNVWVGVSVEDQRRADERIPALLDIPARVRWLSVEPLLGLIDFGAVPGGLVSPIHQDRRVKIDWVVVGAESGKNRRDCGVDAIVHVAEQCVAAGVPVWVKQDCALRPGQQGRIPDAIWDLKQLPRIC